jgi:uncharacterized Ntn-hydrolase superfamily protein
MTRINRRVFGTSAISFAAAIAVGRSGDQGEALHAAEPKLATPEKVIATFSITGIDKEAGSCGAAVASMYPAVGKVVPYARADVGAFCTQHHGKKEWGGPALDLLASGMPPEQVIAALLKEDTKPEKRQLGIIDMRGRTAIHNCTDADPAGVWWGAMAGQNYTVQGNTLVGRIVITEMARAFEETKGSLADRLMAALIAADCAGGDHRGRLAAGVRVAKKGIEGNWLELDVDKSDDAVMDLAKAYAELKHDAKGEWAGAKAPFVNPCPSKK